VTVWVLEGAPLSGVRSVLLQTVHRSSSGRTASSIARRSAVRFTSRYGRCNNGTRYSPQPNIARHSRLAAPRPPPRTYAPTEAFLERTHDRAFATSTATLGSFPAIIGGEYASGDGLETSERRRTSSSPTAPGSQPTTCSPRSTATTRASTRSRRRKAAASHSRIRVRSCSSAEHSPPRRDVGWNRYQQLQGLVGEVGKSFRRADDVIGSFRRGIDGRDSWFGWLHFMEPHHPYDPDDGPVSRDEAQRVTRTVLAGRGSEADRELVRELYRREIAELDAALSALWEAVPDETRVVFCADHGELLGEGGTWGPPRRVAPGTAPRPLRHPERPRPRGGRLADRRPLDSDRSRARCGEHSSASGPSPPTAIERRR